MKKTLIIALIAVAVTFSGLNSCSKKDIEANVQPASLSFTVPPGFPEPQYKFQANPLTSQGFELGRKLFYDGILSKDGNFACASCHQQFAAFSTLYG